MRPQWLWTTIVAACLCWCLLVGSVGADGIIDGDDGIDGWDGSSEIQDLPWGGAAQPADADQVPSQGRNQRVAARWSGWSVVVVFQCGDGEQWTHVLISVRWFALCGWTRSL